MANISIGKAWEETLPFVAREASLLFPVALLFIALPTVILGEMTPPEFQAWLNAPKADNIPSMPAGFGLAMVLTILLIWFGSLAVFALALRPGISVGEALRLSFARLPVLIGTSLLAGAGVVGIVLIAVIVAGVLSLASPQGGAALGALLAGVAAGLVFFAGVRLILLNPVVIDQQLGVIASLRQAWASTRGHFWRLLGFLIIVMLLSSVVASVAQLVVGLIGGLVAGPDGARLGGAIAGAAMSAVIQVYMLVMIARLYRQTQQQDVADVFR
jgi:hypothetical protein